MGQIDSLWSRLGSSRPRVSRANASLLFALVSPYLKKSHLGLILLLGLLLSLEETPCAREPGKQENIYRCVAIMSIDYRTIHKVSLALASLEEAPRPLDRPLSLG